MANSGLWTIFRTRAAKIISVVLAVSLVWAVSGRTGLNGPLAPPSASQGELLELMPVSKGVKSIDFLTRVGGLAFGAVAQPTDTSLIVRDIQYASDASDGQRLHVWVSSAGAVQEVVAPIPDWELIPTARFASGAQEAVFTLFGTTKDAAETDSIRAQGYDILNYHPSFRDTLLGLRLFQADVLILAQASANLPKYSAQYLLGLGENAPDVSANEQALLDLDATLFDSSGKQPFQSYLITDYQQSVTFQASNGQLTLDGYPYWYFWRYSVDQAHLQVLWDAANGQANQQFNTEMQSDFDSMSQAQFDAKYTDAYQQARFDEIFDAIISPQALQALPDYSATNSAQIRMHNGINPAVYDALTATMRYAAFFRYVKATLPDAYAAFVQSFDCVRPEPNIFTPGAYQSGGDLILPVETMPGPSGCPSWVVAQPDAGPSTGSGTGGSGNSGSTAVSNTSNVSPNVGSCGCRLATRRGAQDNPAALLVAGLLLGARLGRRRTKA